MTSQKTFVFDQGVPQKIGRLEFDTFSSLDVRKMSNVEVKYPSMYQQREGMIPYPHGPLDRKMGTGNKAATCDTCGEGAVTCVGHFGHVNLSVPLFHFGFFKTTHFTLQIICKTCSRILLSPADRKLFTQKMRDCTSYHEKYMIIKEHIAPKCKRLAVCHSCGGINGSVKRMGTGFKIVHEKYKSGMPFEKEEAFSTSLEANPELRTHFSKVQEILDPTRVLRILEAIPQEDRELLDIPHPEKFILTNIPVPPLCIRPSVMLPGVGGTNEDDLTIQMAQIVRGSLNCQDAIDNGDTLERTMTISEELQFNSAMYLNSDTPGVTPRNKDDVKKIRALCQRLKGKHGRFRGNLSGKRVDFTSRTVISPDPNILIDQLCVPVLVAKVMTYPEKVNSLNREKLQKLVIRGGNEHPGANYVEFGDGSKRKLTHLNLERRTQIAESLRIGDIVERHMEDGDVVLFNRQPSLHKLSIMAHRAKIMPWRTFRFNECVCNPYNADFDGDEMNMHLPQTEEARAEAWHLMGVTNNLITPRSGEPLIAAIQDFITAAYLMSLKDVFLTKDRFAQFCNYMFDAETLIDMPPPAIQKPVILYTGKQIFTVLFKPNRHSNVLINHRGPGKNYATDMEEMDPRDAFVVIRNSELMCGSVDKSVVGSGNKRCVFHLMLRDFGPKVAADRMQRLAKLCARFLTDRGFSIGIDDVTPSEELNYHKQQVMNTNYANCEQFLRDWKSGSLEASPGCTVETTLEHKMNKELSDIRTVSGKLCSKYLHFTNSPLIMAYCGSKGSSLNISQMVACVGQQTVGGSRVAEGFINRTLPHFEFFSRSPEAKGFVKNSFFSGMTATEFFFHTMGGREGLVDTAVKTAETGYMARKLMKALEDLSIQYDHTVRNASGTIIQFEYGGDSLDPANMEGNNVPMEFERVLNQAIAICPVSTDHVLEPEELLELLPKKLAAPNLSHCSTNFMKTLTSFLEGKVQFIREQISSLDGCVGRDGKPFDEQLKKQLKAAEFSITQQILDKFLSMCGLKFHKAIIEPGTAVGALGAQSISEPGTQMTLKTFHFAGVASMNHLMGWLDITQGVPRIREIISASKNISTPIVNAPLVYKHNPDFARVIKGKVERTMLGDIAESVTKVMSKSNCFVEVKLSMPTIRALQLHAITINTIVECIREDKKVPCRDITINGDSLILVYPDIDDVKDNIFFGLDVLQRTLPHVLVGGISSVHRAVISILSEDPKTFGLVVEGDDLQSVMNVEGIDGINTVSNDVIEVQRVLGIEAARITIINEISMTMKNHGIAVDTRHLMLLGDIMTFKGMALGIQRHGIQRMKDSVLMLASFEKTTDHLFDAAVYKRGDTIEGVSECIIVGAPIPVGTGMFKVIQKNMFVPRPSPPLLLDSPQFSLPYLATPSLPTPMTY